MMFVFEQLQGSHLRGSHLQIQGPMVGPLVSVLPTLWMLVEPQLGWQMTAGHVKEHAGQLDVTCCVWLGRCSDL